jgi:FkbM family methyltransferase
MNLLTPLRRPEYFFRPSQIVRRVLVEARPPRDWTWVTLPWGHRLLVNPRDQAIGLHVLKVGLDDLPLCETIWRLLDEGDRAVDVGGNMGLIASLMLCRVGASGSVTVLEPHPRSFAVLERNACQWGEGRLPANLQLWPVAAGAQAGEAWLIEPEAWDVNSGGVAVADRERPHEAGSIRTTMIRLDDAWDAASAPSFVKIDVEGRQDAVLQGARGMLQCSAIRHVIFEVARTDPVDGETAAWLQQQGYACFVIARDFWGPRLIPLDPGTGHVSGHATNILATTDPGLARRRLARRGWHCLAGTAP